jgi:hypothetical protein
MNQEERKGGFARALLLVVAVAGTAIGTAGHVRAQYITDTVWDPRWPPLPYGLTPSRPIATIREAYAFAVRRPDVLQYMPCYCGCEREGHKSNHSCFLQEGSTKANPQWDSHGYTCPICLDVAHEASQRTAAGESPQAIRTAIAAKYEGRFGNKMKVPWPPAKPTAPAASTPPAKTAPKTKPKPPMHH